MKIISTELSHKIKYKIVDLFTSIVIFFLKYKNIFEINKINN